LFSLAWSCNSFLGYNFVIFCPPPLPSHSGGLCVLESRLPNKSDTLFMFFGRGRHASSLFASNLPPLVYFPSFILISLLCLSLSSVGVVSPAVTVIMAMTGYLTFLSATSHRGRRGIIQLSYVTDGQNEAQDFFLPVADFLLTSTFVFSPAFGHFTPALSGKWKQGSHVNPPL
jgi:hypothetical protein